MYLFDFEITLVKDIKTAPDDTVTYKPAATSWKAAGEMAEKKYLGATIVKLVATGIRDALEPGIELSKLEASPLLNKPKPETQVGPQYPGVPPLKIDQGVK